MKFKYRIVKTTNELGWTAYKPQYRSSWFPFWADMSLEDSHREEWAKEYIENHIQRMKEKNIVKEEITYEV